MLVGTALTCLQEERDREQWEEFEQTWAKRRRLIREKSELDVGPKRREPFTEDRQWVAKTDEQQNLYQRAGRISPDRWIGLLELYPAHSRLEMLLLIWH